MTLVRRQKPKTGLGRDTRGSVFVEAALVLPLTVIILAGIAEWGLTLYQYHLLSTATASAARELIVSRGYDTPFTDVMAEYNRWAANLGVTSNDVVVTVNGATCTTDATCKTKLADALAKPASVQVTYPCTMQFTPKVASPCPIVLSMTGLVE